jgi:hypothetical protein
MLTRWNGQPLPEGRPLGRRCERPGCAAEAVHNPCRAEGDERRGHWHGEVHTQDGLMALCRKHALACGFGARKAVARSAEKGGA